MLLNNTLVQIKVPRAERRRWRAAARRERQTLSDFIRGLVRERLARTLPGARAAEAATCAADGS